MIFNSLFVSILCVYFSWIYLVFHRIMIKIIINYLVGTKKMPTFVLSAYEKYATDIANGITKNVKNQTTS